MDNPQKSLEVHYLNHPIGRTIRLVEVSIGPLYPFHAMSTISFIARIPAVRALGLCLTRPRARALCTMASGGGGGVEERFDLINPDGTLTGVSKARSLVHRDGDLHRSTHIWVMTQENPPALLLQKRSMAKDTFPGRWDVSAAGHITAGDVSLPSAERELMEELGISVTAATDGTTNVAVWLEKAFEAHACNRGETEKHGKFIDNELQDVYILRRDTDVTLHELVLQKEEVEDAKYWPWPQFRDAQRNANTAFVPRTPQYIDMLEQYILKRSKQ